MPLTPPLLVTSLEQLRLPLPDRPRKQQKRSVSLWAPYLILIHSKAFPLCEGSCTYDKISSPKSATHPTFFVGDFVVKFFVEKYSSSFYTETFFATSFQENGLEFTPRIVATGTLANLLDIDEEEAARSGKWKWPFCLMKKFKSVDIDHHEGACRNMDIFIDLLGPICRRFHTAQIPWENLPGILSVHPEFQLEGGFVSFLNERRKAMHGRMKYWGWPPELLAQVDDYLPSDLGTLIDHSFFGVVHGDLHAGNILVTNPPTPDNTKFDVAIIDLGDNKPGDPHYDLFPLHIGCFLLNKRLLFRFLKASSWPIQDINTFVYRCMCYTLLTEYNPFKTFACRISYANVTSIEDLATKIWDVTQPDNCLSWEYKK